MILAFLQISSKSVKNECGIKNLVIERTQGRENVWTKGRKEVGTKKTDFFVRYRRTYVFNKISNGWSIFQH